MVAAERNKWRGSSLGNLPPTPGVLEAAGGEDLRPYLSRHAAGDWGDVGASDARANYRALIDGTRLLSAYRLRNGVGLHHHRERPERDHDPAAGRILIVRLRTREQTFGRPGKLSGRSCSPIIFYRPPLSTAVAQEDVPVTNVLPRPDVSDEGRVFDSDCRSSPPSGHTRF